MTVVAVRGADVDEAVDLLESLLPGLADTVVDFIDALHDRSDDLGPAHPDLMAHLAADLATRWPRTPEPERPLVVLEVLRSLLVRPTLRA